MHGINAFLVGATLFETRVVARCKFYNSPNML